VSKNKNNDKFSLKDLFILIRTDKGKKFITFTFILILSLVSGSTTIEGAKLLFPDGIGFMAGFVIQSILFIFFVDLIPRSFPQHLKSVVLLLLVPISIYGSFFFYYDKMSGSTNQNAQLDYAARAHNRLVAQVFTPLKTKLSELQGTVENFERQSEKEAKGLGATREVGRGQEARKFAVKAIEAEGEIASLKPIVQNLKGLFELDIKKLTPEEILESDRKALKEVPQKHLPIEYQVPDIQSKIKRADYIEEGSNSKIILAFYRITQGDSSAFASLFLASILDMIMLVISKGIEDSSRVRQLPFESLARGSSRFIKGLKNLLVTPLAALFRKGQVYEDDEIMMHGMPKFITICLQGKGSEFLELFVESIDAMTNKINVSSLNNHENSTFKTGFKILIKALCISKWVTRDNKDGSFVIRERYILDFYSWINNVMIDQKENEQELLAMTNFTKSIREIQISWPSYYNEQEVSSAQM
jgi:hypothetical protein